MAVNRILFLQTQDSEKIPVGGVAELDSTLTVSGKPADSAAVGARLSAVETQINGIGAQIDAINGEVI